MTDSFSPAYDSKRNFFGRRWRWVVGALVLYFIVGDWPAVSLGYAETVTQTTIENGKPVGKKTTSWLSSSAQFFRDWRDFLIGIAAIIGIVMAGWRNFALDRQSKAALEQAKIGNRQAQHDRDRIADERFSDAVKLLAQKDAENKPAIDARIGGIYSLQTLANNRIKEYGAQVVRTLIAYIKQNAQLTAQPPLKENETPKEARENKTLQKVGALGEDVKTAFNVLKQLLAAREKDSVEWNKPLDGIKLSDRDLSFSGQDFSRLDLSTSQIGGLYRYTWGRVNLQGANLFCAQLQDANLWSAQLQDANLAEAHLKNAKLLNAQLQGVDLSGAQLQGAILFTAKMQGANLARAQLQGANLADAQLQGANLADAQLQGANLARAQLQGADLARTQLQGAKLSEAQLQFTDLSEAELDDETTLLSNLPRRIWHSGQPELSEIDSLSPDVEWDFDSFLDSGYALVGVLSNFSGRQSALAGKGVIRARKLRVAARKLLDEEKLPEDFPQDWRDWLSEIKSDGSHPNDSGRLG